MVLTVEILAHVCVSKNVGYFSAQVLRIANRCPVLFGFQNISASVMELYLVGSEVPYINCASLPCTSKQTKLGYRAYVCMCLHAFVLGRERETDRQVCIQSVCLIRFDGSLFGRGPAVNTYRWLSSQTLFLNEVLCSLVSHTDMHTQIQTCVHILLILTNTDKWLHSHGHKLLRGTAVYRQTHIHHIVRWQCALLRRAEPLAHHWNFFKAALKAIWSPNDTVFLCPSLSVCPFLLSHHFCLLYQISSIYLHHDKTRVLRLWLQLLIVRIV